eukprot:maker-scaffold_11-snap-gene-12.12-mRNA-1 protein AED:0.01 eAED:0.01 QI:135/1/1/1/0/0/2/973/218
MKVEEVEDLITKLEPPSRYFVEEARPFISRILPLPIKRVNGSNYLIYDCNTPSRKFPYICILGSDYFCSFITTSLIISANVYFFLYSASSKSKNEMLTSSIAVFLFIGLLFFYSQTAYSDPGIIKKNNPEEFEKIKQELVYQGKYRQDNPMCRYCNIFRPSGARHCYDCQACIAEHDHHCPWTGKCIGKNNMKSFQLFLFFLCIDLVFLLISPVVLHG